MDTITLSNLLSQPESETLEFKQDLPASSDLAVLISAFYNTRGGVLVIGVDDERRPVGVGARSTFHVPRFRFGSCLQRETWNVKPGTWKLSSWP